MPNRHPADHSDQPRSEPYPDLQENLSRVLRRAFPLPDSGSFGDLLAALDRPAGPGRQQASVLVGGSTEMDPKFTVR